MEEKVVWILGELCYYQCFGFYYSSGCSEQYFQVFLQATESLGMVDLLTPLLTLQKCV